jgi:RNA polymerase sigma-70 factor (ECF subfamily)
MADGSLSPTEQAALAERIRAGDASAEEDVVRLFYPRVLATLVCRTRDREASRDLAQDVLLAALRALRSGALNDPEKLALFIQGIARNLANNHVRVRSIQRSREDELPADLSDRIAAPLLSAQVEESKKEARVRQALDTLQQGDRDILLLTLDGRKPREIAASLQLAPEVVRQRKVRAIQRIADSIRKLSQTPGPNHFVHGANPSEL